MEKPRPDPEPQLEALPKQNSTLSPSSSGRRSNNPNSPEFEFWMVRNPSFPQPNLHSADELFVDGIILPLCLLSDPQPPKPETPIPEPEPEPEREPEAVPEPGPEPGPGPYSSSSSSVVSTSKRWRDIFKVGDKKCNQNNNTGTQEDNRGEKFEKKKDRKSSSNGTNNTAELNINIWPFSRSRSAGNSGNRPKMAPTRKVSSAPCSRSNSGGESKSKKWPSSPSRGGGIHLGRNSPVWQVRRGGGNTGLRSSVPVARNAEKGVKKDGSDSRGSKSRLGVGSAGGVGGSGGGGLNLNVQMCMGYRQNSSCRSTENNNLVGGGDGEQSCSGGAAANGGGNGVKLFNLRNLFSKKVY